MKKKLWNPPVRGPKLLHGYIGTYRKPKNKNSDYVSIMIIMCSNEPQTNPLTFEIKFTHDFGPLASLLASDALC